MNVCCRVVAHVTVTIALLPYFTFARDTVSSNEARQALQSGIINSGTFANNVKTLCEFLHNLKGS